MFHKKQNGLTLVELIIVIVILAILALIAFMSFESYTMTARDSTRVSDMRSITRGLDISNTETGKFPIPSNKFTVTYSGAKLWEQGTVGENVIKYTRIISKIPTDPLNNKPYAYSVTPDQKEYEVVGTLEENNSSIGGRRIGKAVIMGNFNSIIARASTGGESPSSPKVNYILALPSITTSDLNTTTIEGMIQTTDNLLVFDKQQNLPANLDSVSYILTGSVDIKTPVNTDQGVNLVVWSGTTTMPSKTTTPEEYAQIALNVQDAYSGTTLATLGNFPQILSVPKTDTGAMVQLGKDIIGGKIGSGSSDNRGGGGGDGSGGGGNSIYGDGVCVLGNAIPIGTFKNYTIEHPTYKWVSIPEANRHPLTGNELDNGIKSIVIPFKINVPSGGSYSVMGYMQNFDIYGGSYIELYSDDRNDEVDLEPFRHNHLKGTVGGSAYYGYGKDCKGVDYVIFTFENRYIDEANPEKKLNYQALAFADGRILYNYGDMGWLGDGTDYYYMDTWNSAIWGTISSLSNPLPSGNYSTQYTPISLGTDGVCGSSNGTEVASAPTTNLCSKGTPSAVSGSEPWRRTCNSPDGGKNTGCSTVFNYYSVSFPTATWIDNTTDSSVSPPFSRTNVDDIGFKLPGPDGIAYQSIEFNKNAFVGMMDSPSYNAEEIFDLFSNNTNQTAVVSDANSRIYYGAGSNYYVVSYVNFVDAVDNNIKNNFQIVFNNNGTIQLNYKNVNGIPGLNTDLFRNLEIEMEYYDNKNGMMNDYWPIYGGLLKSPNYSILYTPKLETDFTPVCGTANGKTFTNDINLWNMIPQSEKCSKGWPNAYNPPVIDGKMNWECTGIRTKSLFSPGKEVANCSINVN